MCCTYVCWNADTMTRWWSAADTMTGWWTSQQTSLKNSFKLPYDLRASGKTLPTKARIDPILLCVRRMGRGSSRAGDRASGKTVPTKARIDQILLCVRRRGRVTSSRAPGDQRHSQQGRSRKLPAGLFESNSKVRRIRPCPDTGVSDEQCENGEDAGECGHRDASPHFDRNYVLDRAGQERTFVLCVDCYVLRCC